MKLSKKIKPVHIGNILDKSSNFNELLAIRAKIERPVAVQRPLTPRNYSAK